MSDAVAYFITWTTHGSWLPGDARGWHHRAGGSQLPRPELEAWCRQQLKGDAVLLTVQQREKVASVCHEHSRHRGWLLYTVDARSNHVHVAVTANLKPQTVRDQLKANGTRVLRQPPAKLSCEKIWTRGGDCEVLYTEDELERVIAYINQAQDCDPQLKR